jgi:hypothetical protein
MPNENDSRPADQAGSTFFHQSWPIAGGSMMIQIRTSRPLIDTEYVELGKAIFELEHLAELLGVDRGDFPLPEEPTTREAASDADA